MKKALYAGSFDPITYGHKDVVQRSARHFDELTVGIGVNPAKEGKYTFSLQERLLLSRQTLADVINADVVAFRGMLSDFAYENDFSAVIRGVRNAKDFEMEQELQRAIERQKLGIETFLLNATQGSSDISSSVVKSIIKEQGDIRSYVPLNVKQALEGRMLGQYLAGITGSVGAGKSYTTDELIKIGEKNGIPVHNLDLDILGHEILGSLQDPVYQKVRDGIADMFGNSVQKPDGSIDRKALGEIVFSDPEKLKKLNEIMKTPLMVRLRREMINKDGLLLHNAALIAEADSGSITNNNILLLDIDPATQAQRLAQRGLSTEEIEKRIKSQYSSQTKAEIFNDIIAKEKRGSLIRVPGTHTTQELEQHFNQLLAKIDTFGELRFMGLLNRLGVQEDTAKLFVQLRNMYDKTGNTKGDRKEISESIKGSYHKRLHVIDCLNQLYEIKHLLQDPDAVECALLFHDIVYDPTSKTNEEDSATLAEKMLIQRGLPKEFIEKIQQLILATKHIKKPKDNDTKFIMDIDMAIFGKDDRKYLQYAKDVRKEYYMYNDDQYTAGRVKFLHSLLPKAEKNTLYHTDHFKNTHDPKQARWNILTEIREITGEIPPC